MRSRMIVLAALVALVALLAGCGGTPSTPTGGAQSDGASGVATGGSGGSRMSAKEAVAIAKEALPADWKATAKLALVSRWSKYAKDEPVPLDVEEDPDIGSDGKQGHWIVIFVKDESASPANVYYVEDGQARLVKSDIAVILPDDVFGFDGWVDSTEIDFRSSQRVGLELRTSNLFEDVNPELAKYPLLWLAETSFGHNDIYDAATGKYIMSKP